MFSHFQLEIIFNATKYTKGMLCLTVSTGQCEMHVQQTRCTWK